MMGSQRTQIDVNGTYGLNLNTRGLVRAQSPIPQRRTLKNAETKMCQITILAIVLNLVTVYEI